MEILAAIVLLSMGIFSTTVAVLSNDLSMLIPAGLCYLSCGSVLIRICKEA